MNVDLEDLAFDRGGALIVKRALATWRTRGKRSQSQAATRI